MYESLSEMIDLCDSKNIEFWQLVIEDEAREKQIEQNIIFENMRKMYSAMVDADKNYDNRLSASGMVGGDGARLSEYVSKGKNISGPFLGHVMERAVKMGESNACMKRIVAAPTAGSCGVIPAVLITYHQDILTEYGEAEAQDRIVKALFVAGGIGQIIANRASIAGAQGGCQAEIGSASAMAAGAVAYLSGGDNEQIVHAAALALKGLLGLVCDPVAGLVEVPCVKRNVIGAVNAVTSSDMAMAGVKSFIPPDQVIDAMDEIGRNMPCQYRETSEGGLAATEAASKVQYSITIE